MTVRLIYASSLNNVIGQANKLPWHLPEDLDRFKRLTRGGIIIMGRNTWESLPPSVRPLPERTNYIVTSSPIDDLRVHTYDSLEGALYATNSKQNIWIIGGQKLLQDALQYADEIELTRVFTTVKGNNLVHGPNYTFKEWRSDASTDILQSSTGMRYQFVKYLRADA